VTLTATAPGAQGEFALLTSSARMTLSGATMISLPPIPANQEFASLIEAGSNALVALSIQATVNHANSLALFEAANDGVSVTSGAPAVATVTLTPSETGQRGAFSLATDAPARIVLSDDHMTRTLETWTALLLNSLSAPIVARMDAGLALTGTDIDVVLNAVPGVSNTSISSPASSTLITDILSILGGRGYYIPAGKATAINAWTWNTTAAGGFGIPYYKQDSQMLGGELRPFTVGGDLETHEINPIRYLPLTDQMIESLDDGELAVFLALPGMPPVTLWPSSSPIPHHTWTYQKAILNPVDPVFNARVIVVYNDDGTVLA
jgi:hypothetical protein